MSDYNERINKINELILKRDKLCMEKDDINRRINSLSSILEAKEKEIYEVEDKIEKENEDVVDSLIGDNSDNRNGLKNSIYNMLKGIYGNH